MHLKKKKTKFFHIKYIKYKQKENKGPVIYKKRKTETPTLPKSIKKLKTKNKLRKFFFHLVVGWSNVLVQESKFIMFSSNDTLEFV